MSGETHEELVLRAVAWLRSPRGAGCQTVFAEMVTAGTHEVPDAIGWQKRYSVWSFLVEVKVSRADYQRDAKKRARCYEEFGMGRQRYYLTPAGLLAPEELPAGWGLLEAHGRRVQLVRPAEPREVYDHAGERSMLLSAIRRQELGVAFDRRRARWAPVPPVDTMQGGRT